jgi:hypothetical protein
MYSTVSLNVWVVYAEMRTVVVEGVPVCKLWIDLSACAEAMSRMSTFSAHCSGFDL